MNHKVIKIEQQVEFAGMYFLSKKCREQEILLIYFAKNDLVEAKNA